MGLLDGMLGNASKVDNASVQEEFAKLLAPGEKVEHAYKLIRDLFVFTDKRLVVVDKQGLTGSKVEYHSIPVRQRHALLGGDGRQLRHGSRAQDLDLQHRGADQQDLQQEAEHLRGAVRARELRAALKTSA